MPADHRPTREPQAVKCSTCTENGRRGACALLRCYCGHPTCWAYGSWVPIGGTNGGTRGGRAAVHEQMKKTWDNREEDTWIDKV